jgi:CPA1 family monovalent cation:H+ antiporter
VGTSSYPDTVDERVRRRERDCTALRLAALAQKRTTLIRLRDEHRIDDGVLRELQTQLDIEEVRLSRREAAE